MFELARCSSLLGLWRINGLRTAVTLANLSPSIGSHKKAQRVGRGPGSGGRTCGRGRKGQLSRSGPGIPRGFAGGQTPLHISAPKVGFTNAQYKKEYAEINLDRIQHLIDTGRIDAANPITIKSLYDAGIRDIHDGIKVLGGGADYLRMPICLMASRFSQAAIARVEELGGHAIAVYHTPLGLRALCRPDRFHAKHRLLPRFAAPIKRKDRLFYSDLGNRGYLAPEMLHKCIEKLPNFTDRYVIIPIAMAQR